MPQMESSSQNFNVKLVHATKQNSPTDPIKLAFSITDPEQGMEDLVQAEIPDSTQLFDWLNEQGYVYQQQSRRSTSSIQQLRQRRAG